MAATVQLVIGPQGLRWGDDDELLVLQLLDGQALPVCQRVLHPHHDHGLAGEQGMVDLVQDDVHFILLCDDHIHLIGGQLLPQGAEGMEIHLQVHVGIALEECRKQGVDGGIPAQRVEAGHLQHASFPAASSAGQHHGGVQLIDGRTHTLVEEGPLRGEGDAAVAAHEELEAQVALDQGDVLAQGGLSDVQPPGSLGEVETLRRGEKCADARDVDHGVVLLFAIIPRAEGRHKNEINFHSLTA